MQFVYVPICNLHWLFVFQSVTQEGYNCDTESRLLCSSELFVSFDVIWSSQPHGQSHNEHKFLHMQELQLASSYSFAVEHINIPLCSNFLKSNQPISSLFHCLLI